MTCLFTAKLDDLQFSFLRLLKWLVSTTNNTKYGKENMMGLEAND